MNALKKLLFWIKSPKSDFFLFVICLVLANLISSHAYIRMDITAMKSYSLSPASKELVGALDEPVSIKVFFTANLPAPYNSVERYLKDLLIEYQGAANKNFVYDFLDMENSDNKSLASSYGLYPFQIQEIKNDEVGFKNAYMGLSLQYADSIEKIDGISSTDGLEYKITTTMARMINKSAVLSGLDNKISMKLYASSELAQFGIGGFNELDSVVTETFADLNSRNQNKLQYSKEDPSRDEVEALVQKYGLQKISWTDNNGEQQSGILGILLEYQDRFSIVSLDLVRTIFGSYAIEGLDTLAERSEEALRTLVSNPAVIAYSTGHGEKSLYDERTGAARLNNLVSDLYELQELDLSKENIPGSVSSLVINGPKEVFSEEELYKIDQFIMRGGRVLFMLDPFEEKLPDANASYYGAQPEYIPIETGLEKLLNSYGMNVETAYVLDTNSYKDYQQGMGEIPLYYIPVLDRQNLDQSHPASRNLSHIVFLLPAPVQRVDQDEASERSYTVLARSSDESWLMKEDISLQPQLLFPPADEEKSSYPLVLNAEGFFDSAFDKEVQDETEEDTAAEKKIDTHTHIQHSILPGKITVLGTSMQTSSSILDEAGNNPSAVFMRNIIDHLNGNENLIDMRTKGLSVNPIDKSTPGLRTAVKIINQYGLPLLVILSGLLVWRLRSLRRKRIQKRYAEAEA